MPAPRKSLLARIAEATSGEPLVGGFYNNQGELPKGEIERRVTREYQDFLERAKSGTTDAVDAPELIDANQGVAPRGYVKESDLMGRKSNVWLSVPLHADNVMEIVQKIRGLGGRTGTANNGYVSEYNSNNKSVPTIGATFPDVNSARLFEKWYNGKGFKTEDRKLWVISESKVQDEYTVQEGDLMQFSFGFKSPHMACRSLHRAGIEEARVVDGIVLFALPATELTQEEVDDIFELCEELGGEAVDLSEDGPLDDEVIDAEEIAPPPQRSDEACRDEKIDSKCQKSKKVGEMGAHNLVHGESAVAAWRDRVDEGWKKVDKGVYRNERPHGTYSTRKTAMGHAALYVPKGQSKGSIVAMQNTSAKLRKAVSAHSQKIGKRPASESVTEGKHNHAIITDHGTYTLSKHPKQAGHYNMVYQSKTNPKHDKVQSGPSPAALKIWAKKHHGAMMPKPTKESVMEMWKAEPHHGAKGKFQVSRPGIASPAPDIHRDGPGAMSFHTMKSAKAYAARLNKTDYLKIPKTSESALDRFRAVSEKVKSATVAGMKIVKGQDPKSDTPVTEKVKSATVAGMKIIKGQDPKSPEVVKESAETKPAPVVEAAKVEAPVAKPVEEAKQTAPYLQTRRTTTGTMLGSILTEALKNPGHYVQ